MIYVDSCGFVWIYPTSLALAFGPFGLAIPFPTSEARRAMREAAEGLVLAPGHQLCKLGIRELLACARAKLGELLGLIVINSD